MATITLSAAINQAALKRTSGTLPSTSTPLTKIQQLYQHTTYVESESIYSTPEKPVRSYIAFQYLREESAILIPSEGSEIVIWCKSVSDDRILQFTKKYFMMLVNRKQVYSDTHMQRIEHVGW
jgi:hypothetical protein